MDAVAAGDGAFSTWMMPSPSSTRKSSTSAPDRLRHCARIPEGPNVTSADLIAGMYRRISAR
jgi:hypothetical protein